MDWFYEITGFTEIDYATTKSLLSVNEGSLVSARNNRRSAVGKFTLSNLRDLRNSGIECNQEKPVHVSNIVADVRKLHSDPENEGALFQVASQVNMLEMIGPDVTPEDGVTRYQFDRTQGPACAMAAGAATIYRNYFVPVGGKYGQTASNQMNGLTGLADGLGALLGKRGEDILPVRNGYALPTHANLLAIANILDEMPSEEQDRLAEYLEIGVHTDVEVTDVVAREPLLVTQAFCSAMPVAYSGIDAKYWEPLAKLVLNAAYEATLWVGLKNAMNGRSNRVLLTRLGGGAFGNRSFWIDEAMETALHKFQKSGLEIVIVSYGSVPVSMMELAGKFSDQ